MPNENSATWGVVGEPVCSGTGSQARKPLENLGRTRRSLRSKPKHRTTCIGEQTGTIREFKSPKHRIHTIVERVQGRRERWERDIVGTFETPYWARAYLDEVAAPPAAPAATAVVPRQQAAGQHNQHYTFGS